MSWNNEGFLLKKKKKEHADEKHSDKIKLFEKFVNVG